MAEKEMVYYVIEGGFFISMSGTFPFQDSVPYVEITEEQYNNAQTELLVDHVKPKILIDFEKEHGFDVKAKHKKGK